MTNDQLDSLTQAVPEELRELLGDLHPHIREACSAALEESQEGEGKAKVKVSFGLTIDLCKSPPAWTLAGSVGITRKVTGEAHQLDDPSQLELGPSFGRGTTMTIKSGDSEPITITSSQAKAALNKIPKGA